jgi:osmotically-inducible protein OsmY
MSGRADLGHDTRSSFGPVYEEPMNGRCIANEDSAASVCSATSGELHHRFSAGPYDPPTMNKTNAQLRNDVIEELVADPALDAVDIAISANDGIVTLAGTVKSYAELLAAERAVKRVAGCHRIARTLKIEIPASHARSDSDIARAAGNALSWEVTLPANAVTVRVDHGYVALEGTVEWEFQRLNARRVIDHLAGVRGVYNDIVVKPRVTTEDVERKLRSSFERSAAIDADRICVNAHGGTVVLSGTVDSWYEHEDAVRAAYSIPGVTKVENLTYVS